MNAAPTPGPAVTAPPASTPVLPTGRQIVLRHGESEAVVTEVGAALRRYRVGGRDVVVPFAEDVLPPAAHGAVLLPWPGRIGDGRYTVHGRERQLDLSEPERGNAIHGLVRHTRWQVAAHTEDTVDLTLDLVPRDGYPFPLHARLRYALGAEVLTLTLTTTNTGRESAPYGAGFHPWLSPGRHALDDCTATVDASGWIRVDDRLLPVEELPDVPADVDLRTPRRLRGVHLDDTYVTATEGDGPHIGLTDPDGVTAFVRAREGFTCWQVFTGDGLPEGWVRSGLAAEPMTCAADAFRTGDRLVTLSPGDSHTCRAELGLRRPGAA